MYVILQSSYHYCGVVDFETDEALAFDLITWYKTKAAEAEGMCENLRARLNIDDDKNWRRQVPRPNHFLLQRAKPSACRFDFKPRPDEQVVETHTAGEWWTGDRYDWESYNPESKEWESWERYL